MVTLPVFQLWLPSTPKMDDTAADLLRVAGTKEGAAWRAHVKAEEADVKEAALAEVEAGFEPFSSMGRVEETRRGEGSS